MKTTICGSKAEDIDLGIDVAEATERISFSGVAHFFDIEASNSVVICRLSRRDLTVSDDPALESRVARSSLNTRSA